MRCVLMKACRWCKRRQAVDFGTDGNGRLIEYPLACGCDELHRRGVCIDCRAPRAEGKIRCEGCAKRANAERMARYRANNPEAYERMKAKMRDYRARAPRICVEDDCDEPVHGQKHRCLPCWHAHNREYSRRASLEYYHRTKGRAA